VALQFLVGCIVSVINIMIHALITLTAIEIARWAILLRKAIENVALPGRGT
jgi:hypothetical protein